MRKKLNFLSIGQVEQYESWLSDQAAKGLYLLQAGGFLCWFHEGEPARIEYRLDYENHEITAEKIEQRKEQGWEYIDSLEGYQIFSSLKAEPKDEIYTESQEFVNQLSDAVKKMRQRTAVFVAIACMIFFTAMSKENFTIPGRLIYAITGMFAATGLAIQENAVWLLQRRLEQGRAMNHHRPWKNGVVYCCLVTVSMFIYFGLTVLL